MNEVYDLKLGERIRCTDEERAECADLVFILVSLAHKARKEGFSFLEKWSEREDIHPTLREGIAALLRCDENATSEDVRHALEEVLNPGGAAGRRLMERYLVMEGLCLLVTGSTRVLFDQLAAFFGEDYYYTLRRKVRAQFDAVMERRLKAFNLAEYCEAIAAEPPVSEDTALLEDVAMILNSLDVQAILDEFVGRDRRWLAGPLRGASGQVRSRFLSALARDEAFELRTLMDEYPLDMLFAQDQGTLFGTIQRLAEGDRLSFAVTDVNWPGPSEDELMI